MIRTILLYSVSLATLILALNVVEYHFLVQSLSLEIYLGTVALLFTGFGVWAGWQRTRPDIDRMLPTTQGPATLLSAMLLQKKACPPPAGSGNVPTPSAGS